MHDALDTVQVRERTSAARRATLFQAPHDIGGLTTSETWPPLNLREWARGGFYHEALGEFILRYDDFRAAVSPRDALLEFAQSTYEAAADLGKWDRGELER